MATASMRGTAPSHTKVTWNGMSLNSPMLGMVDFVYTGISGRRCRAVPRRRLGRRIGGGLGRRRHALDASGRRAWSVASLRTGHRVVLDIRRVSARLLWQRPLESIDAYSVLVVGQRFPLHQLPQDQTAGLRRRGQCGRQPIRRGPQPLGRLRGFPYLAGGVSQHAKRPPHRSCGMVHVLAQGHSEDIGRLPRRLVDPHASEREHAARRSIVGEDKRLVQGRRTRRIHLHRHALHI